MSALPVETPRHAGERIRNVAENLYYAPAPAKGPGFAAKARFAGYVIGSSIAWILATFVVVGVLATVFR